MRSGSFTEFQLMIFEKEHIECKDVAALLGDYVDHELPLSLRDRIDAHLLDCDECKEMERSYRMTVELAHELRDKPMPLSVKNRLRENLNKKLGLNLSLMQE